MAEPETFNPNGPHWHIVVQTSGGVVSVIRDLTLEQVRNTYESLDPWRGMVAYTGEGVSRHGLSSDAKQREVFGPPGWDRNEVHGWQRWPRPATEEEQALHKEQKAMMRELLDRVQP